MSLAGFKKQLNKANQFVSEKIGGAKGTELDEDYVAMGKKVDVVDKLVTDVMAHTQEYLQPNPASRAKLMTQNAWSKVRGQATNASYPQPEGTLGETLVKHGQELGEDSEYGQSCIAVGDAFKQLAEAKYGLEGRVKQNFLEPLLQLQSNDLKEIGHHRKKLEGRRLDYDCKRRKREKGGAQDDAELRMAEEKFSESKDLTERAMANLLSNGAEQMSQLNSFVEAVLDYHREAVEILESVYSSICDRAVHLANKPRPEHVPKRVAATPYSDRDSMCSDDSSGGGSSAAYNDQGGGKAGSYSFGSTPAPTVTSGMQSQARPPASAPPQPPVLDRPCAKALYDFDPENEGELAFKEGDTIELTSQIDENWFEGKVRGQAGFFPINYVKVVVPL